MSEHWKSLPRAVQEFRDHPSRGLQRARAWLLARWHSTRERALRITLGTRLFLVLVSMAAATSLIIVVLQDSSLSDDLESSAQDRLQWTSDMAAELLDEHLADQFERYESVSGTPQFIANLEAAHGPTLTHYAKELAQANRASVVLFVNSKGTQVAGFGEEETRALVMARMRDVAPASVVPGGKGATTTPLLAINGAPYSVINVPLRDGTRLLGGLIALEPIRLEQLSTWSRLCRARVSVDGGALGEQLTRTYRKAGDLEFRVTLSFEDELNALAHSRKNAMVGGMVGLALAMLASLVLARNLVRPIHAIRAATERIASGDLDFRLDERRSDEVGDVARGFNSMLERLDKNIRERLRVEDQISHLAYHDSLTGLGNRRMLKERLERALHRCEEQDTQVAVMFLDLDRFKDINDTLGHSAGDELLMEVARRIDDCLERMGLADRDGEEVALLTRLGGDEFTILLGDVEDKEQVETLAKRIRRALSEPVQLRGQDVRLSTSIGTALAPQDTREAEALLRYSDMAMFHAKARGGRGHEFYSEQMQELASQRVMLERKIQLALEEEQFEVYYQPKLDLETGQAESAEALLRWNDPARGLVGPAEFIPMAEETGAIVAIGDWVLQEAMQQAIRWQAEGVPPVRIAVNVSARQLECGNNFAERVAELLEETGLDPALLDLEITEGAMLKDEEAVIALLEELRGLGVGLALDDFGTGYSSLSYLRRLPINTLKIDRSFIIDVETDPEEAALVESIISMAKTLNLRVVAEGVETQEQQTLLDSLGCHEIQGYLFSKPLPAAATAEFLCKKRRRRAAKRGPRKAA